MFGCFAKSKSWVYHPIGKIRFAILLLFLIEIFKDFAHQIIVMRVVLHRFWIAFFMHRNISYLIVEHRPKHLRIIIARGNVIDHIDAQANASQSHRTVIGIYTKPRFRKGPTDCSNNGSNAF